MNNFTLAFALKVAQSYQLVVLVSTCPLLHPLGTSFTVTAHVLQFTDVTHPPPHHPHPHDSLAHSYQLDVFFRTCPVFQVFHGANGLELVIVFDVWFTMIQSHPV